MHFCTTAGTSRTGPAPGSLAAAAHPLSAPARVWERQASAVRPAGMEGYLDEMLVILPLVGVVDLRGP